METILSSNGRLVLPAKVRRQLRLPQGERLSIEVRRDSVVLRPVGQPRRYRTARHPKSGLPVVAVTPPARKVTAADIARLHAE